MQGSQDVAGQRERANSLSDWARVRASIILNPIAHILAQLGVHPNTVTILGLLLQIGVGALFCLGRLRGGGLLLLIVAPMDALDGALARAVGREGQFGAFLDSTLDRLADAALILGLTGHYLHQGVSIEVGLLLVGLVAAMMVSYTRARAEGLGVSCRVGVLTRMERVGLIGVLSALGLRTPLVWTLVGLSVFTFFQRVAHVYSACSQRR